jgi:hypothetical protein
MCQLCAWGIVDIGMTFHIPAFAFFYTIACLANITINNKKDELNFRKFEVLDFFPIDCKYSCGQIKLGSNFFYCKSELNIKSPEKSSPRR